MAGLYAVAESWLNDIATPETRGCLLAGYMIVSMGGSAVGQFLLTIADPRDVTLFIVASVLVSLAVLPVALSTTSAPPITEPEPMSLRELLAVVPTGVVSMFFIGTAAGTMLGMGAVYATRVGLSSNQTAVFLTAPIVMTQVSDSSLAGTLVLFVLGGTMFPLYSLTIAYTNDWIPVSKMVAASSSLVMANGAGAVVGPLLTAVLFAQFGTGVYYVVLSAAHGLVAVYVGYRIMAKDPMPMDRQRAWVPFSSRSTGAVAVVTRPLSVRQKP